MICRNCGKELTDLMAFCPNCGAKREETPESDAGRTETPEETEYEEKAPAEASSVPETIEEAAEERPEEAPDTKEQETPETAAEETGSVESGPEDNVLPEEENGSSSEESSEETPEESPGETPETAGEEAAPASTEAAPETFEEKETGEEGPQSEKEQPLTGMPTPLPLTRLRASIGEQAGEKNEEKSEENGAPGRAGFAEARDRLLAVAGSGFMLLLCIVLSLQVALSFAAGVTVTVEVLRELFEGNSVTSRSVVTPSLIEIATMVLLWVVYARARKSPPKTSGGVIKALRVFAIIQAVLSGLAAGLFVLAGLGVTLVPQLFGLSRYGSGIPGVDRARVAALLGVSLFLTTPVFILAMVYQILLARYYGGVLAALDGTPKPIKTGFLRAWCWIGIVVNALGALGGAALLGAGKYVVYGMTDFLGYRLTPESESAFITAVIAFAVVTIVSSLAACLLNFAKERLFRNSSRAVREGSGPETV